MWRAIYCPRRLSYYFSGIFFIRKRRRLLENKQSYWHIARGCRPEPWPVAKIHTSNSIFTDYIARFILYKKPILPFKTALHVILNEIIWYRGVFHGSMVQFAGRVLDSRDLCGSESRVTSLREPSPHKWRGQRDPLHTRAGCSYISDPVSMKRQFYFPSSRHRNKNQIGLYQIKVAAACFLTRSSS